LSSDAPEVGMHSLKEALGLELKALTVLRKTAGRVELLKLKGVLLDTIHSVDVCGYLISSKARDPSDWAW